MDMPSQLVDRLLPQFPMVSTLLPAMVMPLAELPMVDMLLLAMDMLFLTTDKDMLLSTTDHSTMGKDINPNT